MKNQIILLAFLLLGISLKAQKNNKVLLCAIVYKTECNSESYAYHKYKIADRQDRYKAMEEFQKTIKATIPKEMKPKFSDSMIYGTSATNACVIKWDTGTNKCLYSAAKFCYGTSASEALEKANVEKKIWADRGANSEIIEQISF